MSLTRTFLLFLSISLCLAQDGTTIDDADSSIAYSGQWTHDNVGSDYLYAGTQSWTNDPAATLTFNFQGTGFDFCAGLKADRGTFSWTVDKNVASGTGTELGTSMTEGPCNVVASVRNLDAGSHSVVIANTGAQYLAADSFTYYADGPVSATNAPSSSASMRSRSSSSLSMSVLPSSSSLSIGKATISNATNRTAQQEEDQQVSSGHKAAVIGGSIAGVIVAATLSALSFWLWKRRQTSDGDSIFHQDKDSPSAEEKNFPWNEKRPLSSAAGPAGGGFSHSHSHSIPRSQGIANLHKRQISRQDSLESFTEVFQPETLRSPPQVEPYPLAQFTPTHSTNPSQSSQQQQRNIANPFDVAPLRTKSSYEGRLAAASASLPDFHSHSQPIARKNNLQHLQADNQRVRSEVSSAYPATERGVSQVDRHSMAYSGMELEGDEEDQEGWRTFEAYQNSPIGFGGHV